MGGWAVGERAEAETLAGWLPCTVVGPPLLHPDGGEDRKERQAFWL